MARIALIFLFLLFANVSGWAQPGDPGGDPDVPITGIEILLSMGAYLGVKKLLSGRKKN